MKSPFFLQLVPERFKEPAYTLCLDRKSTHLAWKHLFEKAGLKFAPGAHMFDLVPGDFISGKIAFTGFFERKLSLEILRIARTGGVFVDVGANMGYYSLIWLAANTSNKVVAFEAAPRILRMLEQNIKANGFQNRTQVIPKAAGRNFGTVEFDLGSDVQTGWGGISGQRRETTVSLPVTRVDHEISLEYIQAMKIDVEGAETWVIAGCEKLLKEKRIERIYFEHKHPRMADLGISLQEVFAFLSSVGYAYKRFSADKILEEWVAFPRQ